MLLAILGVIALALTCTLFASKQSMLGFPCLIFWAITGGQCYLQSTATWDIYYMFFFGSFGMAIFCTFAAFALRTKKEEVEAGELFIDEGKPEEKYIDEGGPSEAEALEDKPSRAVRGVRERAAKRRERWD